MCWGYLLRCGQGRNSSVDQLVLHPTYTLHTLDTLYMGISASPTTKAPTASPTASPSSSPTRLPTFPDYIANAGATATVIAGSVAGVVGGIALIALSVVLASHMRDPRKRRRAVVRRVIRKLKRNYAVFLSHHKDDAADAANTLSTFFAQELMSKSFLDVNDMLDMSKLRHQVNDSCVLVVLQTAEYLYRPWCLIELYQAILSNIPIVPILIEGRKKKYDFEASLKFLRSPDFRSALNENNPGAAETLEEQGIDVQILAQTIANRLPQVASKPYNSFAIATVREAQLAEILKVVMAAFNELNNPSVSPKQSSPDAIATVV